MPPWTGTRRCDELEDHQGAEEQELEDERQRGDEGPRSLEERQHGIGAVDTAEYDRRTAIQNSHLPTRASR